MIVPEEYRQYLLAQKNDAEVFFRSGESFEVGLKDGEIETYEAASAAGISLRVRAERMGYAATENVETPPDGLYESALENASITELDEEAPLYTRETGAADFLDEGFLAETAQQKIALAKELNALTLKRDGRITRLKSCVVASGMQSIGIFNTKGLDVFQRSGYAIAYVSAVARQNGETKDGSALRAAKSCGLLDLAGLAAEAAEEALCQFGAAPLPSGKYDVIIRRDAMASLLGAFRSVFSSEAAQRGLSLLSGKEGEKLFASCISITDAPRHAQSVMQTAYDAEGVPCRETKLVNEGRLNTLLYNLRTAAKAGKETTGNAGKGGLASSISVQPNNFFLEPGERDFPAMCAALGTGLVVTDFSGLHAGVNAITGDFSLQCRGFLYKGGAPQRPVNQVVLSGNYFFLLGGVECCGADLFFSLPGGSCVGAPSVLVRDLAVSGT